MFRTRRFWQAWALFWAAWGTACAIWDTVAGKLVWAGIMAISGALNLSLFMYWVTREGHPPGHEPTAKYQIQGFDRSVAIERLGAEFHIFDNYRRAHSNQEWKCRWLNHKGTTLIRDDLVLILCSRCGVWAAGELPEGLPKGLVPYDGG